MGYIMKPGAGGNKGRFETEVYQCRICGSIISTKEGVERHGQDCGFRERTKPRKFKQMALVKFPCPVVYLNKLPSSNRSRDSGTLGKPVQEPEVKSKTRLKLSSQRFKEQLSSSDTDSDSHEEVDDDSEDFTSFSDTDSDASSEKRKSRKGHRAGKRNKIVSRPRPDNCNQYQYTCPVDGCGGKVQTRDHLRAHFLLHLKNNPFTCPIPGCRKKLSSLWNFKRHIDFHVGKHAVSCKKCGQTYSQPSKLKYHHECSRYNPKREAKRKKKKMTSVEALGYVRSHYAKLQANGLLLNDDYIADEEDFNFRQKIDIQKIIETDPIYLKVCEKCPSFPDLIFGNGNGGGGENGETTSETEKNRRRKRGEAYQCRHCTFTSSSLRHLKAHYRLKHASRPWSCSICGLTFVRELYLKAHMKFHESTENNVYINLLESGKYQCTKCKFVSRHEVSVKRHWLLRHKITVPSHRKVLSKVGRNRCAAASARRKSILNRQDKGRTRTDDLTIQKSRSAVPNIDDHVSPGEVQIKAEPTSDDFDMDSTAIVSSDSNEEQPCISTSPPKTESQVDDPDQETNDIKASKGSKPVAAAAAAVIVKQEPAPTSFDEVEVRQEGVHSDNDDDDDDYSSRSKTEPKTDGRSLDEGEEDSDFSINSDTVDSDSETSETDEEDYVKQKWKKNVEKKSNSNSASASSNSYACSLKGCGVKVKSKSQLKSHFILHLKNNPYACPIPDCDTKLQAECHFRRHIEWHLGKNVISCKKCGQSYSRPDKFRDHHKCSKQHLRPDANKKNKKSFNDIVGYVRSHYANLKAKGVLYSGNDIDIKNMSEESYFNFKFKIDINPIIENDPVFLEACEDAPNFREKILGGGEADSGKSKRRGRRKRGEDFRCSQCTFTSSSRVLLGAHFRQKHVSRPWRCAKCGLTFLRESYLTEHMKFHESTENIIYVKRLENGNKFQCTKCRFVSEHEQSVKRHWQLRHNVNVPGHRQVLPKKGRGKSKSNGVLSLGSSKRKVSLLKIATNGSWKGKQSNNGSGAGTVVNLQSAGKDINPAMSSMKFSQDGAFLKEERCENGEFMVDAINVDVKTEKPDPL